MPVAMGKTRGILANLVAFKGGPFRKRKGQEGKTILGRWATGMVTFQRIVRDIHSKLAGAIRRATNDCHSAVVVKNMVTPKGNPIGKWKHGPLAVRWSNFDPFESFESFAPGDKWNHWTHRSQM